MPAEILPSLAVLALAKEERTDRLVCTSSASSLAFLLLVNESSGDCRKGLTHR